MRIFRVLLGLLLIAAGALAATVMGYPKLLVAAYALGAPAFGYCTGTTIACVVLYIGGYVARSRLPGFMTHTLPKCAATPAAFVPRN